MTAAILDGRALAAGLRDQLRDRVAALVAVRDRAPALRVVAVGANEATELYLRRLIKVGQGLSIDVSVDSREASLSPFAFGVLIGTLNRRRDLDGVVVTLPLPAPLSTEMVASTLDPAKDVDGITVASAGGLYLGRTSHPPSTAAAIVEILEARGLLLAGKHAVVVGRSPVVGRPVAMLLLHRNATVTVCHSRTPNLAEQTRAADVLVVAVGRPGLIRGWMIKPGATVVDAGINVCRQGIRGDVDFEEATAAAGAITPVPGGVGPVTTMVLLRAVVANAESRG